MGNVTPGSYVSSPTKIGPNLVFIYKFKENHPWSDHE
jgi:hypothetical protein